jgi:hypothetical protein
MPEQNLNWITIYKIGFKNKINLIGYFTRQDNFEQTKFFSV